MKKKTLAWCVVDENTGKLALFDYRLPLTWNKSTADCPEGFKIIRVEIREVRRKRK